MDRKNSSELNFELEIILMVSSWNPIPKTFATCCRMRHLALLAAETIADIRDAAVRRDVDGMKALFESFREKYNQITSATPK